MCAQAGAGDTGWIRFSMTTLIFANGMVAENGWLDKYLETAEVVIAANGGTQHLLARGVRPDIVIGDMDSLTSEARFQLETAGTRFLEFPRDKDETDLELALLDAVRADAGDILVFGALGGRLDQTIGNILLLAHPALAGRNVRLVEPGQQAWLVEGQAEISGLSGDIISLIPIGGDVRIKMTTGLRWSLRNEVLTVGPARGISNQMTADVASINVASGRLLCVHTTAAFEEGAEHLKPE